MQEQATVLAATRRERLGSRYSKRLRDRGSLPAIVYGHGQDPVAIALDAKEALTHFHRGEKVFQLDVEGAGETVLLKDVQFDYLGTNVIHADFARVDLNERVETNVSVRLVGDAKGLKEPGAILMHPVDEVEIECLVANLPDVIEVDVSDLAVGDSIRVEDITLPLESMKMLSDPDGVVATIVVQAEEKVEEEVEVEAGEGVEPELITEKKEEGEEEKEGDEG
jgi:large subunit ribosomal protein L25